MAIVNWMNAGTVPKGMLGKLLRAAAEQYMGFSEQTELN